MFKRRGRLLFVNKKKQKNFLSWAVLVSPSQAQPNKSFLRRFFSKKRLPSCFKLNLTGSNVAPITAGEKGAALRLGLSTQFKEPPAEKPLAQAG
jgi:hypothetical protein